MVNFISFTVIVMCYVHKVEEMYLKIEFGQEEEAAIQYTHESHLSRAKMVPVQCIAHPLQLNLFICRTGIVVGGGKAGVGELQRDPMFYLNMSLATLLVPPGVSWTAGCLHLIWEVTVPFLFSVPVIPIRWMGLTSFLQSTIISVFQGRRLLSRRTMS